MDDQAPLPGDAAVVLAMLIAPSYIKTLELTSAGLPVMVGLLPIVEPVIGDEIVGFRGGVESTVTMTAVEAGLLLWAVSSALAVRVCLPSAKAVVRVNDQAPLPVDVR